jgi:hypothetical protein
MDAVSKWCTSVCQGTCCTYMKSLGASFAEGFRLSESTTASSIRSRTSVMSGRAASDVPGLSPTGGQRKTLQRNRPLSRSQPADLSRLNEAAAAQDRAENEALMGDTGFQRG